MRMVLNESLEAVRARGWDERSVRLDAGSQCIQWEGREAVLPVLVHSQVPAAVPAAPGMCQQVEWALRAGHPSEVPLAPPCPVPGLLTEMPFPEVWQHPHRTRVVYSGSHAYALSLGSILAVRP